MSNGQAPVTARLSKNRSKSSAYLEKNERFVSRSSKIDVAANDPLQKMFLR